MSQSRSGREIENLATVLVLPIRHMGGGVYLFSSFFGTSLSPEFARERSSELCILRERIKSYFK